MPTSILFHNLASLCLHKGSLYRKGLYRLQRDLVLCAAVAVQCWGLRIAPSKLPTVTLACDMKLCLGMRCWH